MRVDEVARGSYFDTSAGRGSQCKVCRGFAVSVTVDESASSGGSDGVYTSGATFIYDVDTYAVVGFEWMACLTTCTNSDAHILVIFGGGFDHGYKQQRTPLVAGIDNVYNPLRRLAGIWVRLGRAYLLFTFTTLYPVWQGCGGRIWAGPRIKNVKYRIFDHYAPPVVTPRRQSCASERDKLSFAHNVMHK